MGVVYDCSGVIGELRSIPQKAEAQILSVLSKAGRMATEKAKATKTYQDQTGALTASIGYGVFKNGSLIEVGGFGDGIGRQNGEIRLMELSASTIDGYALIIVAGMDYAIYVERKGFVVLDGGTLGLGSEVEKMLKGIEL